MANFNCFEIIGKNRRFFYLFSGFSKISILTIDINYDRVVIDNFEDKYEKKKRRFDQSKK